MPLQPAPKKKRTKQLDPKFSVGPKPLPKKSRTEEQRLQDVLKKNQRVISPKGVAAADAAAKKAIEKKYPGMFIPETRTKAGVKKVGNK
jgi:hypothetical protein